MELVKANTPEELYQVLGEFLKTDYSREDLLTSYEESRKCANRFRVAYSDLPEVPKYDNDPLDGIQEMRRWCEISIKAVEHIVTFLDEQTIDETICQLKKLKSIAENVHSLIDTELKEQLHKEIKENIQSEHNKLRDKSAETKGMSLAEQSKVVFELELKAHVLMRQESKHMVESYLSKDITFRTRVSEYNNEIGNIFDMLNNLVSSNTLTGKWLDIYCGLKNIPLQKQFNDIADAYCPIEDWTDMIVGNCSRLYNSIAIVIQTFEAIREKTKVAAAYIHTNTLGKIREGNPSMISVFISHSSKDKELAECLIELLKNGLNLKPDSIRCTSVDGHRLPAGANTDEQLKCDVCTSKVLIGLISLDAIDSLYVLFELGARWGTNKPLIPVLARGLSYDILKGPLSGINGIRCDNACELHQLIENLAGILQVSCANATAYQKYVDAILAIKPLKGNGSLGSDRAAAIPTLSHLQTKVVKQVSQMGDQRLTVRKVTLMFDLSEMEAEYNLDELTDTFGLLERSITLPGEECCYSLTHKGRGYVLKQDATRSEE